MKFICRRIRRGARTQQGAVAIVTAISVLSLLIVGGILLDFGVVRMERQSNKSAADDAAAAGVQAAKQDDTGEVHNASAVCTAYEFLRANRQALGGLPSDICGTVNTAQICIPGDHTTDASYHATTSWGGKTFEVWIKMPYLVSDTTTGGAFPEESLSTLAADTGASAQAGCDQLGVVITEWTKPGLGSLVHAGTLKSRVRSVARLNITDGDLPPALLLLERTKCNVLSVGSSGSPSRITVTGGGATPATIHSDSAATGAGCGSGSNQQLIQGHQTDAVVAYGGTDGSSGMITSVATDNGVASNVVVDNSFNVYGTTAVYPASPTSDTPVLGRKLVTRRIVDKRYLAGVTSFVRTAYNQWNLAHTSTPSGYTSKVGCPPSGPAALAAYMAPLAAMTAGDALYVDCPDSSGITMGGSIGAGTVYFHGFIKNGNLAMPNATRVYIDDTDDTGARVNSSAITLGNGNAFCVRATAANCNASTPAAGQCSSVPTGSTSARAQLIVRRGQIDSTGGSSPALLRLCNTTGILEGGQLGAGTATNPGGCLPTSWGTAPTSTPCVGASSSAGTSPVSLSGNTDWTAPNAYGDWATTPYLTDGAKQPFWDGGEDLALWVETYGTSSTYKMAGGGQLHVAGVFMTPNAAPFNVTGSGYQDLRDAQFICTRFAVDGGASLLMRVDPYNAVGMPEISDFQMVR